jgi:hypothetical protein
MDKSRDKASLENVFGLARFGRRRKDLRVVCPRAKRNDALEIIKGIVKISQRRVEVTRKATEEEIVTERTVFEAKLTRGDIHCVTAGRRDREARTSGSLKGA